MRLPIQLNPISKFVLGTFLYTLFSRLLKSEDFYIDSELFNEEYEIGGAAIINSDSILDTLEQLTQIYSFDVINIDGVIMCLPTTRENIAVIETKDIINATEEKKIYEEINIPQKVNLQYFSIDGELTPDIQTSILSRGSDGTEQSGDTPFLIPHFIAKNAAMSQHRRLIEEAKGKIEIELPPKYRDLKVGDFVQYDGSVLRIQKIELKNYSQKLVLQYIRAYGVNNDVEDKTSIPPPPPPIVDENTSKTIISIMDTHILNDSDDELILYVAVQGETTTWNGCSLDLSLDGGESWQNNIYATSSQAVFGYLKQDLDIADRWYPDTTNIIDIEMVDSNDEVDAYTNPQQLNRFGMLYINGELLSYGGVVVINDGRYELSHLFRGRRGTEIKKHDKGSLVTFLNIGAVVPLPMQARYLNRELTIRVKTFEREDDSIITFVYNGNSQRERKPIMLKSTPLGDGTLRVEWVGVGRVGGGAVTKMGKYFEGYVIDVDGTIYNQQENSIIVNDDVSLVKVAQKNYYTGVGEWAELAL